MTVENAASGQARRHEVCLTAIAAALSLGLSGCASGPAPAAGASPDVAGTPPSGTVEMRQVQAAFIGSGGGGTGTLHFRGQSYPFRVAGLGVGGIGVSTIDARGDVFGLTNVALFPGAYGQVRYGAVAGTASIGDLWLQNNNGVVMHLRARRTGLMLSLGGDAVVVSMSR